MLPKKLHLQKVSKSNLQSLLYYAVYISQKAFEKKEVLLFFRKLFLPGATYLVAKNDTLGHNMLLIKQGQIRHFYYKQDK